ncbi:MAG: hypothetical protein M3443_00280 [Actinomycetota bacterium]|nr:hypothetical protein [Actinomycetota bacterium]
MTDYTVTAARRYSELHSGFRLVTAVEAAIPVSWLTLDLVALERKPLPVVEEFTLRLCQQGMDTIPGIAAVLGLDDNVVRTAVANQLSAETLDYRLTRRPDGKAVRTIRLTETGVQAATDLNTTTPQRVEQNNAFDRLLWVPTEHTKTDLISRDQAQAAGRVLLPASRTREVATADVTPRALNTLISESEEHVRSSSRLTNSSTQLEVLAVEAITRQPRRYLPVVLLVFSALDFDEIRLSVVVDDLTSEPHSSALQAAGGSDKLGITVAAPVGEPPLPTHLQEQRVPYDTVRGLQRRADNTRPGNPPAQKDAVPDDSATARAELNALTVRSVPTFEHRELLAKALSEPRRRLLLITSHIADAVVDQALANKMDVLLRRQGFSAHIAYRAATGGEGERRLRRLAERYANLTLIALSHEVPHCLIFDDTWINSAFDWLSYCGGPDLVYRAEEGTLVRAVDLVRHRYDEAVALIEVSANND